MLGDKKISEDEFIKIMTRRILRLKENENVSLELEVNLIKQKISKRSSNQRKQLMELYKQLKGKENENN